MTFQYEIDGETYSRPGRFGVECRRVDGTNENVYFDDRQLAQIEFDRVKLTADIEFLMFFDYGETIDIATYSPSAAGKSHAQLKLESDAAIDAGYERWLEQGIGAN